MEKKQIEITEVEFDLLSSNSLVVEKLEDVMESIVRDGENCHVSITQDELAHLIEYVEADADAADRRLKKQLLALAKYLKTL